MNVLVTGGSRGIGKAIVEKFALMGHNIAFCAKNEEKLQALYLQLSHTYPQQKFLFSALNASKNDEVMDFVNKILSQWQNIDVLVNNAGTYIPGNISEQSFEELEQQIHTNLYSAFHFTKAILPKMKERNSGHIFNMCSIASLKAYPGGGAYSISKYALLGFNDNLRDELKNDGIKVTAVLPGAVYTDSWSGSGVSKERIMDAEDIAHTIYEATQLTSKAVIEQIILRPQLGDL